MDKVLIISNPSSGQKNSREIAGALNRLFDQKGIITNLYETTGDDDFKTLVQMHLVDGFDTVAVLGGDGTISKFANEISDLEKRPNILLLPLGTTNNLARALETELDLNELLSILESGRLVNKEVDVGQLNDQYFVSTVSIGSVPEMAWEADDDVKEKFGPFGYVLEGLQALNEPEVFDVSIKTDEHLIDMDEVLIIVIGLSNSVFGIPTFFEGARVDDGKLHMYVMKHADFLSEVGSMARHILPDNDGEKAETESSDDLSLTTSFKHATIEVDSQMNFAIDGEKGPQSPVTLEVLNKHLTFIVPEKDNENGL